MPKPETWLAPRNDELSLYQWLLRIASNNYRIILMNSSGNMKTLSRLQCLRAGETIVCHHKDYSLLCSEKVCTSLQVLAELNIRA